MAKNTSIGIDIGSSQIKVVLLKKTSSGVRIDKYFIESLNASPSELTTEVRKNKITEILKKVFKAIKPLNIISTVAKGEDSIRSITMPLMTEKSLREVLKWGGQPDYIPFDLKEMIWDINISQIFRRKEEIKVDGKEKMDVVLALAKKEVVNQYLDIAEGLKISFDILESNVLAGLNFSCFNLAIPKEKVWSKIDLGAESTAVSILEGDDLKFSLNVPWGVNDVTESIQSALSKSWEEAEEFACKIDFSVDSIQQDDLVQQVFQKLGPKLKDFLRQLIGAFSFYESKNPGKIVVEVMISGGGANLLNFDKYLFSKTGKEIKKENVINKNLISYDKKEEEKLISILPSLNVAIGVALRNLQQVKNIVNLLPLEIMIGRKLRTRRFSIVTVVIAIFVLLIGATVIKYNERKNIISKVKKLEKDYEAISKEVDVLDRMSKTILLFKEIEKEYSNLGLEPGSKKIYELVTILPEKIWIRSASWDSMSFRIDGRCKLKDDKKESLVKRIVDVGMETTYYKNLSYDKRVTGDDVNFSVSKRTEKREVKEKVKETTKEAEP